MREWVCNYVAIRFLPYRETAEFVNVGVVVYCPEIDFLDFKLSKRRYVRIKHSFPELDLAIFSASIEAVRQELQQRKAQPSARPGDGYEVALGQRLENFRCFVRRRESLLHFSDVAMTMTTEPTQVADELYRRFVERDFAHKKEYQETVMRRRLGEWLEEWNLKRQYLTNARVGGAQFHVRFPFVHQDGKRAVKALKPLDLAKGEATEVYEHGDAWVNRLRRLRSYNHLPDQVVFAVNLPGPGAPRKAADEVRLELEKLGDVEVVPFTDKDRIRELAKV
jgi:hypothetical protein